MSSPFRRGSTRARAPRPTVALTGLLVVLALTSGCSADPEPVAEAPVGPPPATAPSTAPAAVPASAPDTEHATDFLVAWFGTLNYGFATGDADPLRSVTALTCFTCAEWIKQVQGQSDDGLVRTGGLVALRDAALVGADGTDFVFRASVEQQAGSVGSAVGTPTPVAAAGSTEVVDVRVGLTASLTGSGQRWVVKTILPPS